MDCVIHQALLPMGILQARILRWIAIPFSRGTSQPRDQPRSSALQADYLLPEPQASPSGTHICNNAIYVIYIYMYCYNAATAVTSVYAISVLMRKPLASEVSTFQVALRIQSCTINSKLYNLLTISYGRREIP